MLYANILAHEVLWLGLLGKTDVRTAEAGCLASGSATNNALLGIKEDEAEAVADAMDTDVLEEEDK